MTRRDDGERTVVRYRAAGAQEFALVALDGFRTFPPRLPQQPPFAMLASESRAVELARDHNTRDRACGYVGYVLRFRLDRTFADRFAGAEAADGAVVPDADMDALNRHLAGTIEVIGEFRGKATQRTTAG